MGELNVSILGTKSYWNDNYKKELDNYKNFEDPGDEWFGRSATKRLVNWILKCNELSKASSVLDIGCGNGLLLLELCKSGYKNLTGVDYCKDALELAKEVFKSEGFTQESISWLPLDITTETVVKNAFDDTLKVVTHSNNNTNSNTDITQKTYDLCLDKGTYDAISLNPDDSRQKRLDYLRSVKRLLSNSGFFVIVSCNWTSEELKQHFSDLTFVQEIPAPTFTFGGKQGQTVSTCVFKYCKERTAS